MQSSKRTAVIVVATYAEPVISSSSKRFTSCVYLSLRHQCDKNLISKRQLSFDILKYIFAFLKIITSTSLTQTPNENKTIVTE